MVKGVLSLPYDSSLSFTSQDSIHRPRGEECNPDSPGGLTSVATAKALTSLSLFPRPEVYNSTPCQPQHNSFPSLTPLQTLAFSPPYPSPPRPQSRAPTHNPPTYQTEEDKGKEKGTYHNLSKHTPLRTHADRKASALDVGAGDEGGVG